MATKIRLLRLSDDGKFEFRKFAKQKTPKYAILSHTWGFSENDEVTFQDIKSGGGSMKDGYKKLSFCSHRAQKDSLEYFWVDTCCIDKSNSQELQAAIGSMFRWYKEGTKCYVYLTDVSSASGTVDGIDGWRTAFRACRWFKRGWTLQELLAPSIVEFFAQDGSLLGDKQLLSEEISQITGIPQTALETTDFDQFTIEQRLSWAAGRITAEEEDESYCLLGILGVSMIPHYSEGREKARQRLLDEVYGRGRSTSKALTNEDIDRACLQALNCPDSHEIKLQIQEKQRLIQGLQELLTNQRMYSDWLTGSIKLMHVRGGARTGKTTLVAGLIEELLNQRDNHAVVAYFFCQARNPRVNTVKALIKGLIFRLTRKDPEARRCLRARWDTLSNRFNKEMASWRDLWTVFLEMIEHCRHQKIFIVIDALDECLEDELGEFLGGVNHTGLNDRRVRWLLTSRPLDQIDQNMPMHVESRAAVLHLTYEEIASAVESYIDVRVRELDRRLGYGSSLCAQVHTTLARKAEGTFLWASLICQKLEDTPAVRALSCIEESSQELDMFYEQVVQQLKQGREDDVRHSIMLLQTMLLVWRPLQKTELAGVIGPASDRIDINNLLHRCASLVRQLGDHIDFVHSSIRTFLVSKKGQDLLKMKSSRAHGDVAAACLHILSRQLRPGVLDLKRPDSANQEGRSLDVLKTSPLGGLHYAAVHWPLHLAYGINETAGSTVEELCLQAASFIRTRLLVWFEYMSLAENLALALKGLGSLLEKTKQPTLAMVLGDAGRILARHYHTLETWPLQAYLSAVIFSPCKALLREQVRSRMSYHVSLETNTDAAWDMLLQTLKAHEDRTTAVAISMDRTRIASGSADKTIKLWDAMTGTLVKTFRGHSSFVSAVALSTDGRFLATGSWDDTVKVWAIAADMADVLTFEGHRSGVTAVAISTDGKHVVSGSDDKLIIVWSVTTGELVHTLRGHADSISAIALSADGRIASGSWDTTVRLWSLSSGSPEAILPGHSGPVTAVAISADGRRVISGSQDQSMRLWLAMDDAAGFALEQTVHGHAGWVTAVAISADGRRVVSGSWDKTVKIWSAAPRIHSLITTLEGHLDHVNAVAISADGSCVVSGSDDTTVKIWSAAANASVSTTKERANRHSGSVEDVAISADGRYFVTTGTLDNTIKVWSATEGELERELRGHQSYVNAITMSADGEYVVSGSCDDTVKVWSMTPGQIEHTLRGHTGHVNAVALSADGRMIVSGSSDKTIKVWPASHEPVMTLKGHSSSVTAVSMSADGERIISGSDDKTIRIWSVKGDLERTIHGHRHCINNVTISLDRQHIISGSWDNTVKIWSIMTGELEQTIESVSGDPWTHFRYLARTHSATNGAAASTHPNSLLSAQGHWIYCNKMGVLRLPPEIEVACYDTLDDRIVIGCRDGRVLQFAINRAELSLTDT